MRLIKLKKLRGWLFLILCIGLVGCGGNFSVLPGIPELEAETLKLINQERANNKGPNNKEEPLPKLTMDARIVEQARKYSSDMANKKVPFDHVNLAARVAATGIAWSSYGENIAKNSYANPTQTAVTGWMNSDGHRKNILGNYDLTGIGVVKTNSGIYYFTQIFIKTK